MSIVFSQFLHLVLGVKGMGTVLLGFRHAISAGTVNYTGIRKT